MTPASMSARDATELFKNLLVQLEVALARNGKAVSRREFTSNLW